MPWKARVLNEGATGEDATLWRFEPWLFAAFAVIAGNLYIDSSSTSSNTTPRRPTARWRDAGRDRRLIPSPIGERIKVQRLEIRDQRSEIRWRRGVRRPELCSLPSGA